MATVNDHMFGTDDPDERERNNPDRMSGTVGMQPHSFRSLVEEDVLPILGTYYVEDYVFGKRWYFWNIMTHNPFRGIGSDEKSYVYDLDDVTKQHGHTCLYEWWDNTTLEGQCGPVLRVGDEVTFVPKRTEALMRDAQGEILVETISSTRGTVPGHAEVPFFAAGMAVRVALDAKNPAYRKRDAPKL